MRHARFATRYGDIRGLSSAAPRMSLPPSALAEARRTEVQTRRTTWLYTPADIPRFNANMVDGAIRMGAFIPSQLGINRPHPLLADYRTPIDGLYMAGSSNHGGDANGAPGYNAANVIADDLQIKRPWTPVPMPEWRT